MLPPFRSLPPCSSLSGLSLPTCAPRWIYQKNLLCLISIIYTRHQFTEQGGGPCTDMETRWRHCTLRLPAVGPESLNWRQSRRARREGCHRWQQCPPASSLAKSSSSSTVWIHAVRSQQFPPVSSLANSSTPPTARGSMTRSSPRRSSQPSRHEPLPTIPADSQRDHQPYRGAARPHSPPSKTPWLPVDPGWRRGTELEREHSQMEDKGVTKTTERLNFAEHC